MVSVVNEDFVVLGRGVVSMGVLSRGLKKVYCLQFDLFVLEFCYITLTLPNQVEKVIKSDKNDSNVIGTPPERCTFQDRVHCLPAQLVAILRLHLIPLLPRLQFQCHLEVVLVNRILPDSVHAVFVVEFVKNAVATQHHEIVL